MLVVAGEASPLSLASDYNMMDVHMDPFRKLLILMKLICSISIKDKSTAHITHIPFVALTLRVRLDVDIERVGIEFGSTPKQP